MKEKLLGKNIDELKEICHSLGLASYVANQIADWLYVKRVEEIEQMSNISKSARNLLLENFSIGREKPQGVAISSDGTKKYLFKCADEMRDANYGNSHFIESVIIPDGDRITLCVSSQAGCRMGCRFCMTGRQGFHGNLSVAEIINQFFSVDESERITNAVFMGMGEPLDNFENLCRAIDILTAKWGVGWSPKRITVSTIGMNVNKFLERTKVHLAVSLHNPFAAEREQMMPSEHANPFEKTLRVIRNYDFSGQRRVSFEYIMFKGLNDSKRHADAIVRLLRGLECRVNLIRFHDIGSTQYVSSPDPVIEVFKERLERGGITTTIRASRGEDIDAACGMLAGRKVESV